MTGRLSGIERRILRRGSESLVPKERVATAIKSPDREAGAFYCCYFRQQIFEGGCQGVIAVVHHKKFHREHKGQWPS